MNSFLRWAGSKASILRHLGSYWPGGSVKYIEPFCGSARLFFHLRPQAALLADLNAELVRTLRAIQRYPSQVLQSVERLPGGKSMYYKIRRLDPMSLGEIDAAARFVYLNARCFNGLYRTNSAGLFNVPYRPPSRRVAVNAQLFLWSSDALQRAILLHSDFENTCDLARRGDFVYLDPPYAVTQRRIFTEYLPQCFQTGDLVRLERTLQRLNSRGVNFLVTYADSTEARTFLNRWYMRRIRTRRNIAGFAAHRRNSYEVLATNIKAFKES